MKTAIIQCADTGPLESLVDMLGSVGYWCHIPDKSLIAELRRIGLDTVLTPEELEARMGYEPPTYRGQAIPTASTTAMLHCDLYVDVKAHRNGAMVEKRWPSLKGNILWYRINGGKPEHVIRADGFDCGDEVNPPCPILTPNLWYGDYPGTIPLETFQRSYWMYPPFVKWDEYQVRRDHRYEYFHAPLCLIHNINGWGYRDLVEPIRELGVRVHGVGAPDGLMPHRVVPIRLSSALAYVHLKSNDAPGYALYEALAAGCPVVLPRRLIWRCKMKSLFRPGVNCLVFDRETHDALSPEEVRICTGEIKAALDQLQYKAENQRIGEAGRERLKKIMWSRDSEADVASLREFFQRNFPN